MSKPGQNNQKGIYAQNLAAMCLFLQLLRDTGFSYIQLEPDNSEDFDLIFKDGKKIICESKFRKEKFSYPQLKELLIKICQRKSINDRDEILVICKSANSDLISEVKNIRFFEPLKDKFIKQYGFGDQLIKILPLVNFWVIPKGFNSEVNYSLLSELINMWLPSEDVERFVDSILLNKIQISSTQGSVYSRSDFESDVSDFKKEVTQRSDYFNNKVVKEEQFKKLEKDINDNKGIGWGSGSISAFSVQWDLMSFTMDRLKTRNDLDLNKWNDLWQLNKVYYFAFGIFHVFENNLDSDKNKKYVISYIRKNVKDIRGFYRSDFFNVNVVKIITKIIESDYENKYLADAFNIIKDLITINKKEFFYLKDRGHDRGKWEKEEICKLLYKIYNHADTDLKAKVFNLIITSFNITEDEGEFSHYAPKAVYEILQKWLNEDLTNRLPKLTNVISDQYNLYNLFYKKLSKKIEFKGWEHIGGITTYWGNDYRVSDRHFIIHLLAPAIKKFYDYDSDKAWRFIKSKCISKKANISKTRPDFLNRSVYEIVLNRYFSDDKNISKEAFEILKEFICSRKGIPPKTDLIYQAIINFNIPDNKKWKLVELTTRKSNVPINPFVERIVTNLAQKDHQKAKAELIKWFSEPKYYSNQFILGTDSVTSIRTLLETKTDLAIDLFRKLITTDNVRSGNSDHFSAFDIAGLLNDIVKMDYAKGLSILRSLEAERDLSKDQQIIYAFSMFDYHGKDESDDPKLLTDIYNDVVDPFLNTFGNDVNLIFKRLSYDTCREAFVQFATRLTAKKKISEALRIIRIFVSDPDPHLPGTDPKDKNDEFNEHKKIENGEEPITITSVRGQCGWALMKCAVLAGREQIPEIINLAGKLANDENYYVIHMACYVLSQLARNRLSVLPTDSQTLFFNDNKVKALAMAKEVENITFRLFNRFLTWPVPVQKSMTKSVLSVFEHIRALNESEALKLVTNLVKCPKEIINEAAPLFIYFAEFRKEAYKKWRFSAPGLYDDLGPDKYDSRKFKKILIETIEAIQKQDTDAYFRFAAVFEHMIRDNAGNTKKDRKTTKMVLYYFDLLTNVYSHNVFDLIYQVVKDKIAKKEENFNVWYSLYFKCLQIEKEFYDKNFVPGITTDMYWWPSFLNSDILELIYQRGKKEKFIKAAEIIFSFPKELEVHENDNIIATLKTFPQTDTRVLNIFQRLFERNPSKYWEFAGVLHNRQ